MENDTIIIYGYIYKVFLLGIFFFFIKFDKLLSYLKNIFSSASIETFIFKYEIKF